ncbi:Hypothetical protein HDN1F_34550 [gamma proteobacterium HdN1]|nr:Hypothetical protein HDN1F_34550 [gamma proteobacterium HdN1]
MGHPTLRIQLLRKFWIHLSSDEMFGIMSPDKIQRAGLSLSDVRRLELSNIHKIERQINDLRRGYATLDEAGNITPTSTSAEAQGVAFSSIIEFSSGIANSAASLPGLAEMLKNAHQRDELEALGRLLRLQKVYLLAERIILSSNLDLLDKQVLDARWFSRWRIEVSEIPNGPLQQMWARVLVGELIQPGTHSLRVLAWLGGMSLDDAEAVGRLASIVLGDFVHCGAAKTLSTQYPVEFFARLEQLGILMPAAGAQSFKELHFVAEEAGGDSCRLPIGDCEAVLRSTVARTQFVVPAYILTFLGREVVSLFTVQADATYLNLVSDDFRSNSIQVDIVPRESVFLRRKVS